MHVPLLALFELVFIVAAFVLTMSVAWRVSRGGGGTAVSELATANKVLEERIHALREEYQLKVDALGAEIRDLRVENAELRGRTDYQAVINEHEKRAELRADRILAVLDLIAVRLGPEPVTA